MRKHQILRGGSVYLGTGRLRTSVRYWREPEVRDRFGGFRIAIKRTKP